VSHSLPVDRSRKFKRADYPATPKAYEPLDHFVQRYHESERYLDRELDGVKSVRRTITRGDLRDNGDGCGCFVLDWHGVYYYLVVGFHLKGYRVVVSGWPMVRDEQRALDSARWQQNELDEIDQFNNEHFHDSWSSEWEDYVEWSKQNPNGGTVL